jgi:predicted transcriptional regulator
MKSQLVPSVALPEAFRDPRQELVAPTGPGSRRRRHSKEEVVVEEVVTEEEVVVEEVVEEEVVEEEVVIEEVVEEEVVVAKCKKAHARNTLLAVP